MKMRRQSNVYDPLDNVAQDAIIMETLIAPLSRRIIGSQRRMDMISLDGGFAAAKTKRGCYFVRRHPQDEQYRVAAGYGYLRVV